MVTNETVTNQGDTTGGTSRSARGGTDEQEPALTPQPARKWVPAAYGAELDNERAWARRCGD